MRTKGVTGVEIILLLSLLGGALFVAKPALFPGASKRAQQSTEATADVEKAVKAQGSNVAAGITSIGRAASDLPDSPATDFVRREVPYLLAKLPAPDAQALLESERRRSAVMEGKAQLANELYQKEAEKSAKLQKQLDRALQERRDVDRSLAEAAAAEHARTLQAMGAGVVAVLLLVGWAYTKFYSITPATLGRIAADVRGGANPISAMDTHLAPWLHPHVNRASRLALDPDSP